MARSPAGAARSRTPSSASGRLRVSDRVELVGVMYVLRTGVAWRDSPRSPWAPPGWRPGAGYGTGDGVRPRLHAALLAGLHGAGLLDLDECSVAAAQRGRSAMPGRRPGARARTDRTATDFGNIPVADRCGWHGAGATAQTRERPVAVRSYPGSSRSTVVWSTAALRLMMCSPYPSSSVTRFRAAPPGACAVGAAHHPRRNHSTGSRRFRSAPGRRRAAHRRTVRPSVQIWIVRLVWRCRGPSGCETQRHDSTSSE